MNNRERVSYSTEESVPVNSFHVAGIKTKTIIGMVAATQTETLFLRSTSEWKRYERESIKPSLDAGIVRTNARTGPIAAIAKLPSASSVRPSYVLRNSPEG
ncbi:hypothetical protein CCM_04841 [Cordyceps militaris CM01]|uniref:Uncharacterized protein n=1 Tax=Cordyceps militaris (strain CM01) TaxID=983644 RepID=G3JEX4_CORMM|nr:uncharacterized protein CCM_04841 [Cordyceps militaris CM01]EGX93467.1 hypothetical protein CCM_04841 [Cordyceps militaris CM01]